jgi:predicted metal-dependent hydrolase
VRIKDQKHVWGSCGPDRIVNLNWHLIFAPKTVLEYAVVHELCHLRHRNHDRSFWGAGRHTLAGLGGQEGVVGSQ